MSSNVAKVGPAGADHFVETLGAYSRQHRAQHWSGTFEEFLRDVLPRAPRG